MIMYYVVVKSLSELLGEEGILRLPSYLPEAYVFDDARRKAISDAVEHLVRGENVLIEGSPGTGKTALMFMVLRELSKKFGIGYIREGVTSIGNEHFASGIILFYDDLPRIHPDALKSIVKNKIRGLIVTGRTEEVALVKRIHGIDLYEYFRPIRVPPLSDEKIREMLLRYLDREVVRIADENAIDEVVRKANGLPVYVWQVVRELKIRKQPLTLSFAKSIPQGMLDYVDDILWRLLGGKPERYEVLLTLLCMTDFARYAVHQDLFTYIYLVAKERRIKKRLSLEDIVMDVVVEDVGRYLAREGASYAFRLPHDSWADVLRGKSNGPMASEIAKINALYTRDRRGSIVLSAARRAWWETVRSAEDIFRREAFKNNVRVNLGEEALRDILEKPPKVEEKPPVKVVAPPKPVEEVRVMEGAPLDVLRGHLARAKVISKKMLAERMRVSMEDLDSLLEIADFVVSSTRPGFLIYKDHYFRALKRAEELLSKMGVMSTKGLAESVELFPEDIARGLRDKVIVHGDKIFYRDYVWKLIKAEVDAQGYLDLRSIEDTRGIPLDVLEAFRPALEQQYIKSAEPYIYYDREYYSVAISRALRLLEEKGIVELVEVSRKSGLFKNDVANALSGYAIVYGDKVFHREYVWRLLLNEINTKNMICLSKLSIGIPYEVARAFRDGLKKVAIMSPSGDCFYTERFIEQELVRSIRDELESQNIVRVEELAKELDVREEHVRSILDRIGIRSPTDPSTYYAKSFVEDVLRELVRDALSIDDISRAHNIPKSDLQEFLGKRGLEKEYTINRLRRLLGKGTDALLKSEVMEMRQLIGMLNRYDLEPSEANVLGVANIVIWEVSGDEEFFERGVKILESIDDPKARRNLAIAYAKYAMRLHESGADKRRVKNYALLVKQYVKMLPEE